MRVWIGNTTVWVGDQTGLTRVFDRGDWAAFLADMPERAR